MNSEITSFQTILVELILISEITHSEMRITSMLRYFATLEADRVSFRNLLMVTDIFGVNPGGIVVLTSLKEET